MKAIQFIKQFISSPSQTGAVAPSSGRLSELITSTARLQDASVVIEFGPGTGVFTENILQNLPSGATFFALEINDCFVQATRRRCPQATVYHDSAVNARAYLGQHGQSHCDRIISGLPWAAFSEDLQDALLGTVVDILGPGGRFLTFAYLQGLLLPAGTRFRKKLIRRFSSVRRTRTVWRNMPPAFVYCAEK